MSQLQNQSGTLPQSITGGPSTPISIVSSTDTTPIHVIVTPPQNWAQDGDTIRVEGHKTNTNANGLWQGLVVNSTEIVLLGTTGTGAGAGGATGVVYDYNTTPVGVVPSNGDLATGPSVQAAVAAPMNQMPWAYERTGQYRLYRFVPWEVTAAVGTVWSSNGALPAASAVTQLATSSGIVAAAQGGPLIVYQNDLLVVRWCLGGTYQPGASGTVSATTLQLGSSTNGGAYGAIGPAYRIPQNISDTSGPIESFSLVVEGVFTQSTGGLPGTQSAGATIDFCLFAKNYDSTNTVLVNLSGGYSFSLAQLRSNA